MKNVLEYLEWSVKRYADKKAVSDAEKESSYRELYENAQRIGSALLTLKLHKKPVVVFMDKSVEAITSFMGILYSGCFYVFISPEQPILRIQQILNVVDTECIITFKDNIDILEKAQYHGRILDYNHIVRNDIDYAGLENVRNISQDIDPVYCNFTSGSTGVPKGVLVCHRSIIDFIEHFTEMFHITDKDIIGNQAPFDFDVSVKDIYSSLKVGATMVIIPKKYFSIVTKLLDYICEQKITTLIWSVSALCIIAQLKGFTYRVPLDVNKILFSGEMMPIKHLNTWRKYLPAALYVNLYGPTEITCNCTYYSIEREFKDEERIPIGKAFPNEKVFLLDEYNHEVNKQCTLGEICVSGTALALGYYNNPEQTQNVFVQNPLNKNYPEIIYRTGDMGFYDESNNLCFAGRRDFQVKFMGHRIELEEIETLMNSYHGIQRACCVFDDKVNKLIAFYIGNMDKRDIQIKMKESLPAYMIPSVFCSLTELPLTEHGKIDRKKLLQLI